MFVCFFVCVCVRFWQAEQGQSYLPAVAPQTVQSFKNYTVSVLFLLSPLYSPYGLASVGSCSPACTVIATPKANTSQRANRAVTFRGGGGTFFFPRGTDENTVQPMGPDKLDPLYHPINGRKEKKVPS